jgi:hypothetical protein
MWEYVGMLKYGSDDNSAVGAQSICFSADIADSIAGCRFPSAPKAVWQARKRRKIKCKAIVFTVQY